MSFRFSHPPTSGLSYLSLVGFIMRSFEMYPLVGERELEQRVKAYLLATRAELARVRVRADGSTVKLTGQVATFYLRQLALAAAQRVAGVQCVADDLDVPLTYSTTSVAEVPANRAAYSDPRFET